MISLKNFLSKDDEVERALLHVVRFLVQGIGEHASVGESEIRTRFRESIQNISTTLVGPIAPDEVLMQAESAIRVLADHTQRAARINKLQIVELHSMMKMLTSTIGSVSNSSGNLTQRLGEIELQIASASMLDDVHMIKSKLSGCLDDIRAENERHRKETGKLIEELSDGMEQARKQSASIPESTLDRVTGLPLRLQAEQVFAQPASVGTQIFAVVLVLDRLQTLNVRFGREVGDKVLVAFAEMVKSKLGPGDHLFRWSGPTLVVSLLRAKSLQEVRGEVARIVEAKLEHTIVTSSRDILLPIAARWAVFPTMATPRLLFRKIEMFAAVPGPAE